MTTKLEALKRLDMLEEKLAGKDGLGEKLATALQEKEVAKKQVEALLQNIAHLEKRLHELEQYEGFADVLRLLVVNELEQHGELVEKVKGPVAPAVTSGDDSTSIDAGVNVVNVTHHENPPKKYTTEDPRGQFVYVLCNEFKGGPATTKMVQAAGKEYGYDEEALGKAVGSLARDGDLVKDFIPGKGQAYRVPKKIKLLIDGKERP